MMRRFINVLVDARCMSSFYKADLSPSPEDWEETSITEGLGSPDEHQDRFWRKGPYGIEQDSDGTFEAYVLVADTPFKISGGFKSFDEAVAYLTSAMTAKVVPDTPEDKTEQEEAAETESEELPEAPKEGEAKDADDAEDATESTEKAWAGDSAGTDTEEINDAIQSKNSHDLATGESNAVPDSFDEVINRNVSNAEYSDAHPTGGTADVRIIEKSCDCEMKNGPEANSVAKALEGSDDNEGEHKSDVEVPHPGVLFEHHYIDNHALGSARLMSDAPSLEAFEKSTHDFRSLMDRRNQRDCDLWSEETQRYEPFVKADESTGFKEMMGSFRKDTRGLLDKGYHGKRFFNENKRKYSATGEDLGAQTTHSAQVNRHGHENTEDVLTQPGEGDRSVNEMKRGKVAPKGQYGAWKAGDPGVHEIDPGSTVDAGRDLPLFLNDQREVFNDYRGDMENWDKKLGRTQDYYFDNEGTAGDVGGSTATQYKGPNENYPGATIEEIAGGKDIGQVADGERRSQKLDPKPMRQPSVEDLYQRRYDDYRKQAYEAAVSEMVPTILASLNDKVRLATGQDSTFTPFRTLDDLKGSRQLEEVRSKIEAQLNARADAEAKRMLEESKQKDSALDWGNKGAEEARAIKEAQKRQEAADKDYYNRVTAEHNAILPREYARAYAAVKSSLTNRMNELIDLEMKPDEEKTEEERASKKRLRRDFLLKDENGNLVLGKGNKPQIDPKILHYEVNQIIANKYPHLAGEVEKNREYNDKDEAQEFIDKNRMEQAFAEEKRRLMREKLMPRAQEVLAEQGVTEDDPQYNEKLAATMKRIQEHDIPLEQAHEEAQNLASRTKGEDSVEQSAITEKARVIDSLSRPPENSEPPRSLAERQEDFDAAAEKRRKKEAAAERKDLNEKKKARDAEQKRKDAEAEDEADRADNVRRNIPALEEQAEERKEKVAEAKDMGLNAADAEDYAIFSNEPQQFRIGSKDGKPERKDINTQRKGDLSDKQKEKNKKSDEASKSAFGTKMSVNEMKALGLMPTETRDKPIVPRPEEKLTDEQKAKRDQKRLETELDVPARIRGGENRGKTESIDGVKKETLDSEKEQKENIQAKAQYEDETRRKYEEMMNPNSQRNKEIKAQNDAKKNKGSENTTQDKPKDTEPTEKSADDPSARSFRDMLGFAKAEKDKQRGAPVTMADIGHPMRDGRPIRELYRTVTIGNGKDCSSSAYDPKVHQTDSTPKKV